MPEFARATTADAPAAARILAKAFATDPHVAGLLPSDRDVVDRLTRWFRHSIAEAGKTGGWVDVARAGGTVVGAALWEPPGHQRSKLQALAGVPMLVRTYGRRTLDAVRTHREADVARPSKPHWYLASLAADPAAQGTGVGSGLVRAGLARAAADGVGTYLESSTPDNLPFYRRLGFEELDQVPSHGTADLHAMWQDPSPVTGA